MLLKSFADLSSTDVMEDDTPLMAIHSEKFLLLGHMHKHDRPSYSSTHVELP